MAGKASRQRTREKRREEKKRMKMANYVRFGPKPDRTGVSGQGRQGLKREHGQPSLKSVPAATSPKGRRRRRRNKMFWLVRK